MYYVPYSHYYYYTDIDECMLGTNGCSQLCTNTISSFMCKCLTGYELLPDNKTCIGKFIQVLVEI